MTKWGSTWTAWSIWTHTAGLGLGRGWGFGCPPLPQNPSPSWTESGHPSPLLLPHLAFRTPTPCLSTFYPTFPVSWFLMTFWQHLLPAVLEHAKRFRCSLYHPSSTRFAHCQSTLYNWCQLLCGDQHQQKRDIQCSAQVGLRNHALKFMKHKGRPQSKIGTEGMSSQGCIKLLLSFQRKLLKNIAILTFYTSVPMLLRTWCISNCCILICMIAS